MKKLILSLGLLLLTSPLFAGDFSFNAELLWSTRHKQFAGDVNITREKTFCDGWLKSKVGFIPEIGKDKEEEYIAGISIDLLKKWKEGKNCPEFIKKGYLSCGGNIGVLLNDDIKKTRFDFLINLLSYGWEF